MSTKQISISKTGGSVVANISCPNFPQSIVGIIYRYGSDGAKEGQVGSFKTKSPNLTIGSANEIIDKQFLVRTAVIAYNDDPPTPYEIVITISQDGKILSSEVPDDAGKGTISTDDIESFYYFSIKA